MTILQVVPNIGAESSGPSYSVPGLCRGLQGAGCEVGLFFAGPRPQREFPYPVTTAPIAAFPTARLGRSPGLYRQLLAAAETADVIHNNSFWMFPNVYGYRAIRSLKFKVQSLKFKVQSSKFKVQSSKFKVQSLKVPKLVNAPRGTLAVWSLKHHALQKKLFGWFAGQYAAMQATDMWHATSEKEYEEIRAAGFTQPVAIIPIGMDIPEIGGEKRWRGSEGGENRWRWREGGEKRWRWREGGEKRWRWSEGGENRWRWTKDDNSSSVHLAQSSHQESTPPLSTSHLLQESNPPLSTSTSSLHLHQESNPPLSTSTSSLHLPLHLLQKPTPPLSTSTSFLHLTKNDPRTPHRLVFFGRLHAVKRIDLLLRAWEFLTSPHSNIRTFKHSNIQTFEHSNITSWELVIAGPDGGVRGELEAYVTSHHLPRVSFVGEINGPAKYEFLADADLYVLPSSTENFGVTLAEALACGTPALGSKGTPWRELNEWRCGSWGFDTAEELAAELRNLMALSDEERAAMGARGRELIRTNYSWEGVGRKMKAAYEWLLNPEGVERPEWVRVE